MKTTVVDQSCEPKKTLHIAHVHRLCLAQYHKHYFLNQYENMLPINPVA